MKDLRAVRGASLIHSWIAQGEHDHQDFKFAISDACKIARSISAFANNGGGRLLIGVKDNGTVAGVRNEEDIYVVEQAAERYCRPSVHVEFKGYKVDGTLLVIVAEIEAVEERPVMASEPDGSWRAYYRVADENIAAHPLMVEAWRRSRTSVAFESLHGAVAAFVGGADGPLDVRDIALGLHIATGRASAAVADLVAARILRFVYCRGEFRIAPEEEN